MPTGFYILLTVLAVICWPVILAVAYFLLIAAVLVVVTPIAAVSIFASWVMEKTARKQ